MSTRTSIWMPSKWNRRPVERESRGQEKAARLWRSFFGRSREKGAEGKRRTWGERLRRTGSLAGGCLDGRNSGGDGAGNDHVRAKQQAVITGVDDPVAQVRNLRSWEYGPFVNWGSGLGDRSDYKFLSAGFELGEDPDPGGSRSIFERPVSIWREYHAALAGVHAAAAYRRNHLCEFIGAAVFLPLGVRWRNVLRSQPDTGDLSLEFLDTITTVSAVVSGGRRTDLHDSQVSAQLHERCSAGNRRGNERLELLSAGRRRDSLLFPRPSGRLIWV